MVDSCRVCRRVSPDCDNVLNAGDFLVPVIRKIVRQELDNWQARMRADEDEMWRHYFGYEVENIEQNKDIAQIIKLERG